MIPPEIHIFRQDIPNIEREKFLIAHEMAHLILNHSKYMHRELCQESDFTAPQNKIRIKDIARMEYQANYLAGCLLIPEIPIKNSFFALLEYLRIADRGFGPLYVDDQYENRKNMKKVIGTLSIEYGVSFSAMLVRLKQLKLVNDERRSSLGSSSLIFKNLKLK